MLKQLRDKFHNLFSPAFKWIQVEISSLCNGRCVYCPHTIYKDKWHGSLMSLETFEKLIPSLRRTKLVYLQGWGEPFLNPDIFEMIKIAKASGCRVGTTTNGTLVNEQLIKRMIEAGLDIITFSLAGGLEYNNNLRVGTDINHIIEQIKILGKYRSKNSAGQPQLHIAYMVTKSNLKETGSIFKYLENLPIDNLVISTLDFTACKEMATEEIYPQSEDEYGELEKMFKQLKIDGEKLGIEVNYYLGSSDQRYHKCTELPQYACFIAADGSVSPCVFANLPVEEVDYWSDGRLSGYKKLIFGNVNEQSLASIWCKPDYRKFREQFNSGVMVSPCRECRKIHMMAQ